MSQKNLLQRKRSFYFSDSSKGVKFNAKTWHAWMSRRVLKDGRVVFPLNLYQWKYLDDTHTYKRISLKGEKIDHDDACWLTKQDLSELRDALGKLLED